MSVLALDPGLTKPGVAFLHDGKLLAACRLKVDRAWSRLEILDRSDHVAELAAIWFAKRAEMSASQPHLLVVEYPQWYGDDGSDDHTIDPNDLAGLCSIAGSLLGRLRTKYCVAARSPKPRQVWGSLPKTLKGDPWKSPRGHRLASKLDASERARVEDKHDALDAAGLALWAAGRWEARRVFAGAV